MYARSRFTHLNNAGLSPISRPATDALLYWTERLHQEGLFASIELFSLTEQTRAQLADFHGAKADDVSFYLSTANGISQLAFGFPFKSGDEIVLWDQEYPSNAYPWYEAADRTGARVIVARSNSDLSTPVENLKACLTEKTKAIVFSWVQFRTGECTNLRELTDLAKARGILTFADIIQGAGVIPFDFSKSGLDAAVGGSYKWLTSPLGVGYLLATPSLREQLQPSAVGAMTFGGPDVPTRWPNTPQAGPFKFEPGGKAILEIAAFGATLSLFKECGIQAIHTEALRISGLLQQTLLELGYQIHSPTGARQKSPVVNFASGPSAALRTLDEIEQALQRNQISYGRRDPGIRLAPHFFNTEEDINRVARALKQPPN